ncbi:MAG: peptidylprolyl isomerase, partial [Thermodesulfobacteriota bacterium]|nr:peptidylprolyl isomerase [Thermodesulfobacteriota bacterium]
DKFDMNILETLNLREAARENLINKEVIIDRAEKVGFVINKEEVQAVIQSYPAFQKNNKFDRSLYFQFLGYNYPNPKDFEDEQYELQLLRKIEDFISQTTKVSLKEVKDYYDFLNDSVNLEVLKIPETIIKKEDIKSEEKDYKIYYESNKESFNVPAKYKVQYIFLRRGDYISQIKISDTEAMDYYMTSEEKFIEKDKLNLRHIFLRLKEDYSQKEENIILKKAKNIGIELEKGEDFAKLARKYSDDKATAEKGGDLGAVDIKDLAGQLVKEINSLKERDISEPIKTEKGYYIIQLKEKIPGKIRKFSEVKDEIKEMIIKEEGKEKAYNLAKRKARRIFREVKINSDIEQVAKTEGMEIRETGYFIEEDNPEFYAVCKNMNIGEIGPLIETDTIVYIIKLMDKKDPYLPSLKEVKEKVTEKVREEKTKDLLIKKAEEILTRLKAGEDITDFCKENGLSFKETGLFKPAIDAYIPEIGISDEIKAGALDLTKENPYFDEPVEVGESHYVIRLKERKVPEAKELEEKFPMWEKALKGIKKKLIYENWMEDSKATYNIERRPF